MFNFLENSNYYNFLSDEDYISNIAYSKLNTKMILSTSSIDDSLKNNIAKIYCFEKFYNDTDEQLLINLKALEFNKIKFFYEDLCSNCIFTKLILLKNYPDLLQNCKYILTNNKFLQDINKKIKYNKYYYDMFQEIKSFLNLHKNMIIKAINNNNLLCDIELICNLYLDEKEMLINDIKNIKIDAIKSLLAQQNYIFSNIQMYFESKKYDFKEDVIYRIMKILYNNNEFFNFCIENFNDVVNIKNIKYMYKINLLNEDEKNKLLLLLNI